MTDISPSRSRHLPDPPNEARDAVNHAVAALRRGGVVAFPTETVYGLGANAFDPAAIARVFALKGRPSNNPLIVHVSGPAMAQRVITQWTDAAETLASAFWPGPLSIILPKRPDVPDTVTAGGPNVAVRAPNHPLALALLFAFDGPLVGPSANKSGSVSPTRAQHVRDAFNLTTDQSTDLNTPSLLDGGHCDVGIESTVISLVGPQPRILRPGALGAEQLSDALGQRVIDHHQTHPTHHALLSTTEPLPSPGLLASHYAPRAKAILVPPDQLAAAIKSHRGHIVVLARGLAELPTGPTVIHMPPDAAGYAAFIYEALHQADNTASAGNTSSTGSTHPDAILIEEPPTTADDPASAAIWHALSDRLRRATA